MALDEGWEEVFQDSRIVSMMQQQNAETQWASAPINAAAAYLMSRINQPDFALQRYLSLLPAIEHGAGWTRVYGSMACDAADTLWLINRTDSIEIVERNLREKVIAPDFRFPMRDSRLSMAHLCALQNRYDEAREWFAKSRAVLEEQGARPLRAIADFDEALMYQRRGAGFVVGPGKELLQAAIEQFEALEMTGWARRAHMTCDALGPHSS
jgi:hypothetical protein